MPLKNSVKVYIENSYYHIYNRGVEKRLIFQDEQDYSVLLSYLKTYLIPKDIHALQEKLADPNISPREKDQILKLLRLNNFSNELNLSAFCLMPNHFHFLLKQKSANTIDSFMNSLSTRYVMYFNKKYKRVGPLYQGVYKAVLIESDAQLLYLTAYIHRNPLGLQISQRDLLKIQQPTSYTEYLGLRKTNWVKPDEILSYFSRTNPQLSYQSFVGQQGDFTSIEDLTLEDD